MKKYVLMLLTNYLPVLFAVLFYRGARPSSGRRCC